MLKRNIRKSSKSRKSPKSKKRGNCGARLPFGGGWDGLWLAIMNPGMKLA